MRMLKVVVCAADHRLLNKIDRMTNVCFMAS
jgi:hypothetical protein